MKQCMCSSWRRRRRGRYLLRGQVLHASGDLVGAGHQVFERELLVWDLAGVEGVVHAGGAARPQVLPQVALGGVLHQDVQGPCSQHTPQRQDWFSYPLTDPPCCSGASPSCVHAPSRLIMFLCFPIIFIISISDTRSDKSLSVASSERTNNQMRTITERFHLWRSCFCRKQRLQLTKKPSVSPSRSHVLSLEGKPNNHSPFSILAATVSGLLGFSLSMPMASAITT